MIVTLPTLEEVDKMSDDEIDVLLSFIHSVGFVDCSNGRVYLRQKNDGRPS